jgi:hypothetical protein
MSLTRWLPWMLPSSVIVITATFVALLSARPGDRALQHRVRPSMVSTSTELPRAAVVLSTPLALSRVCMTRYGMCPIGPVPTGDPCDCPHPLRGSVPGRAALLGDTAVGIDARYWPSGKTEEAEDPLASLDLLGSP